MIELQMGAVESRFADIIWSEEPISSALLVKKSEAELAWKKSTTFTVLKRLYDKGIFKSEKGIVTSIITRDEYYSMQSEKYVADNFDGSLPAFLTAFTARKTLTAEEVEQLRSMVAAYEEK